LGVPIEMVYLDLGGTVVELISCLLYVRNRETLAELPLIGDQVGLFRAQPGRTKRRMKL